MGYLAGVPRTPSRLVLRRRLDRILEERSPLYVLRSAGGTGKTTLLAQWVTTSAHEDAVIWVTLHGEARSRAGFWVRVLSVLHRVGLLEESTFHREVATIADSDDLVRPALERALTGLPPVLLILDDFATKGDFWDEVCLDILALLQRAASLRCIVAGRFPTLLEGTVARATVGAQVLDDHVMALTDEEVRAFVEHSDVRLDASALELLLTAPAYRSVRELRVALELLERHTAADAALSAADVTTALTAGSRQDLAARLGEARLLDVLGALALAPYADTALADAVADVASPDGAGRRGALLGVFERRGVGYWSSSPDGTAAFRLADHVRSVAAARFAELHPARVPQVLAVVARWLMDEHQDASGAIDHGLRAGDLDYADDVLVRTFPLPSEGTARLVETLGTLPAAQVGSHPFLAIFYGVALASQPRAQARARGFLTAAALAARRRRSSARHDERVLMYGVETAAWRLLGDRRRMLATARRTVEEFTDARTDDDLAGDRSLDDATALAASQAATSLFFGDDLSAARAAYDALSAMAAERGWPHLADIAACGRAMTHVLDGRYDAVRAELAAVRVDTWPAGWLDAYEGALRNIAQAWVHIDEGDPEAALTELDKLTPRLDTIEHWELVAAATVIAQAMRGRATEAERWLSQLHRERLRESTLPSIKGRLATTRTILRLATGMTPEDDRHRPRWRGPAVDSSLRAIVAAVRGADEDAVAQLAQAQRAADTPLQEALTAVAAITVAQRTRSNLSAASFGTALAALISRRGLHWPVTLLADQDRSAVLDALEHESAEESRRVLADAFAAVPAIIDEGLWHEKQAHALTPREQEVLRVLAETDSRAEIADRLYVSINTVKAQLRSLYTKLGVRTREDALTQALSRGLLSVDQPWDTGSRHAEEPEGPDA